MTNRREFIKLSSLASAALMMPRFLSSFSGNNPSTNGRKLVMIQLSGGNDGLNSVIPYQDDIYYQSRPRLGIDPSEVLKISDYQGLNPALAALRDLYDQGELSILNQVGYPNPDRSHFRSMDIWHTGSNSDEYWESGWLGRYLDNSCTGCAKPHEVLEIDDSLSLAVKGDASKALALLNPQQLHKTTNDAYFRALNDQYVLQNPSEDSNLNYLYKTMTETMASAEYIHQQSRIFSSKEDYPAGELGRQLKLVAELIISGCETSVYYTSLSGFDTHVNQRGKQDRLLTQYSDAVGAFVRDLKSHQRMDEVLIMTFSEFGRRVEQNASGGTDHGKANNVFLIGNKLTKPGFYSPPTDLSRLDEGDVPFQTDFREIYASILDRWLGADDVAILRRKFSKPKLV